MLPKTKMEIAGKLGELESRWEQKKTTNSRTSDSRSMAKKKSNRLVQRLVRSSNQANGQ